MFQKIKRKFETDKEESLKVPYVAVKNVGKSQTVLTQHYFPEVSKIKSPLKSHEKHPYPGMSNGKNAGKSLWKVMRVVKCP